MCLYGALCSIPFDLICNMTTFNASFKQLSIVKQKCDNADDDDDHMIPMC